MTHRLRLFLTVALLVSSCAAGFVYECEPGYDPAVCSIWNLVYQEDLRPLPVVNIPLGVKQIRLATEQYYYIRRLDVGIYDATLHSTILGNPSAVQIISNRILELHIPTDLQRGEFMRNFIETVVTNASERYALTYLDVSQNSLLSIANLSVLVELQTLNLDGNKIVSLEPGTFVGMRNLTRLYLGDNRLKKIDFKIFPQGLTELWLLKNVLTELDLAAVSLPALRLLDVEKNDLTTINLTMLLTAFPALQAISISINPFAKHETVRLISELSQRNVTAYLGRMDSVCMSDQYEVDHACFGDSGMHGRVWKAITLAVLATLLVVVFVASGRWIWYQMRY